MHSPDIQVPDTTTVPATADLVVIGAGILGCATAFHAASRGLRVVVLEHGRRLGGLTTQAAGGGHRLQFDTPEEIALLKRSLAEWDAFGDVIGEPGINLGRHRNGYLWVTRDLARAERQREQVARQQDLGVDGVVWLDGDEARRAFGATDRRLVNARWCPQHEPGGPPCPEPPIRAGFSKSPWRPRRTQSRLVVGLRSRLMDVRHATICATTLRTRLR